MKKWYQYHLVGMVCLFSQFMYLGAPVGEPGRLPDSDFAEVEDGGDALYEGPLRTPIGKQESLLQHVASDSLSYLPNNAMADQVGANSYVGEGNLEQSAMQDPASNSQLAGAARTLSGIGAVSEGHVLAAPSYRVVLSPKLQEVQLRLDQTIKAFHELEEDFKNPNLSKKDKKNLLGPVEKLSVELSKIEIELKHIRNDDPGKAELLAVIKEMYGAKKRLIAAITKEIKEEASAEKPGKGGKVEPVPFALASLPVDILEDKYPAQSDLPLLPGDERGEQITGCFGGEIGPKGFPKGLAVSRGGILKATGKLRDLVASGEAKIKVNKEAAIKDLKEGTKTELQILTPDEALAVELFHINRDEVVALTALASNSAVALSPEIIGDMVLMIESGQLATFVKPKANDKDFLKMWHDYYMKIPLALPADAGGIKPLTEIAKFKKSARIFLRILNECTRIEKQSALDLLLAHLDQKVQSAPSIAEQMEMVKEYNQVLDPSSELKLTPYYVGDKKSLFTRYRNENFTLETIESEVENITFLVQALFRDPDIERIYQTSTNYSVMYEGDLFPACQEGAVETFLRLIFYDPVTKELNFSKIPQALQDSMSQALPGSLPRALKDYIETYGQLGKIDRVSAKKALLALIENVSGVKYCRTSPTGARYELDGSTQNTVDLLKALFGIRDDQVTGKRAEELKSIFDLLSTPDHVLTLEFLGNDQTPYRDGQPADRDSFALTLQTPEFVAQAQARFDAQHGETSFPGVTTGGYTHRFLLNLWLAGKVTDQFFLGVFNFTTEALIDSLIISEGLQTKDDFRFFFKNYTSTFDKAFTRPFTAEEVYNRVVSPLFSNPLIDVQFKQSLKNLFEVLQELGLDLNQEFLNERGELTTFLNEALFAQSPLLFEVLLESGVQISEEEIENIMEIFAQSNNKWDVSMQQTAIAALYASGKISIRPELFRLALAKKCGAMVEFLYSHGIILFRGQREEIENLVPEWAPEIAVGILSRLVARGISVDPDTFLPIYRKGFSITELFEIIGKYNYTNLLPLVAEKTQDYTAPLHFVEEGNVKTMTLLEALLEYKYGDFIRNTMEKIVISLDAYGPNAIKEGIMVLEKAHISPSEIIKVIVAEKKFTMLFTFPDPRQVLAELEKLPGFSLNEEHGRNNYTLLDYALEKSSFPYIEVFIEAGSNMSNGQVNLLLRRFSEKKNGLSVETKAHILKLLLARGVFYKMIDTFVAGHPSLLPAGEMAQQEDESAQPESDPKEVSASRDRVDGLLA